MLLHRHKGVRDLLSSQRLLAKLKHSRASLVEELGRIDGRIEQVSARVAEREPKPVEPDPVEPQAPEPVEPTRGRHRSGRRG